jgi:hypothetical protein
MALEGIAVNCLFVLSLSGERCRQADRGHFYPSRCLASVTDVKSVQLRRRGGSFFSLDRKETKDQGLELMLDKRVETLLATAARNEEKSFLPLFWFGRLGEDCAQVSTASPSIISYAG